MGCKAYLERLINLSLVNLTFRTTMNRSKLYEWLLDNDCPFEWEVDDYFVGEGVKLRFYTDEEEDL